ncbi:hypothetical protein QCA50_006321 [Cerrena zonata]|uniref:Uncharacterized protein n=1 Tax=Cerrena zonata TaxID=2478898 RepID=A0AAW0FDN9_9APHY
MDPTNPLRSAIFTLDPIRKTLYSHAEKYKLHLDALIQKTNDDLTATVKQLTEMIDVNDGRVTVQATACGTKKYLDLVYVTPDMDPSRKDMEQVVLRCQGYVTVAKLPPIRDKSKRDLIQSSQSITLSGLGSEEFDRFHTAIQHICNHFDKGCDHGRILGIQSVSHRAHDMITFTNPYFSRTEDTRQVDTVPFSSHVDPEGILEDFLDDIYLEGTHTTDNEVEYFERYHDGDSLHVLPAYHLQNPCGQLVEVEATFGAWGKYVPAKPHKSYALLAKLRSICIIDRIVETDTIEPGVEIPDDIVVRFKRKVGYEADGVDDIGKEERINSKSMRMMKFEDMFD